MTLKHYDQRYEVIMLGRLVGQRKNLALASLMSDMESDLNVPMQRNEAWEKENPEIIELYRKVSNSRSL